MQAGDILFVRGKSLLSRIIRWFDQGDFSHVAIAVSDTHILEAQYFTRSRIVENYFEDYDIVRFPLDEADRIHLKFMIDSGHYQGVWYDYAQIIWYMIERFIKFFLKLDMRNPFNNPNHMICSEIVLEILCDLNYADEDEYLGDITPNELYHYLIEVKEGVMVYGK